MLIDESPDIVCISETWLESSLPDSLLVSELPYTVFRKDRYNSPFGGACLILNNSTVKAVQVDIADNFKDVDVVCVDIIDTYLPIRLIAGYRSPSSDTAVDAVKSTKHFIDCLMSVCDVDTSIVVVGDFNFPSINWSDLQFAAENERCSTLFSTFTKQYCFEQLVSEPTRLQTICRSNLLDLILSNDPFIVCDVNVCTPFSTSDHCCVDFKFVCPVQSAQQPAHELRDFSNADWTGISNYLNSCDWATIFDGCSSSSECSDAFYAKLDEAILQNVPLKIFDAANEHKHLKYPSHIRKLYRAKAAAWRRFKRFKSAKLHHDYKAASSRCRKAVYAHAVKREEAIIESGNLGKFFRYSKSKFTHKPGVGPLQQADGIKTIDPAIKAKLLSQYFQSQFTPDNNVLPNMQGRTAGSGMSSVVFTPTLVARIIKQLNARASGGPDGIPPVFYKNVAQSLCQPLAFLFQIMFDSGHVPPVWRQAFITAIFKKGDSSLPSNYRPISLTCTMCKIMEAIIKDQLVAYLLRKGLISRQQHAFIMKHSTVTNLLECTHDWAVAMHSHESVDVLYIDFSKAFDSVVHSKIIFKLSKYGINGSLLQWISAFLTCRFQCVVTEHSSSDWLPVISGVPQGSVLGPILFILYIDDIGAICSGSVTHKLFADDLKLYTTIKSDIDRASLQAALDRLQQWCIDWQLTINIDKCHVLHIGKNNSYFSYTINGSHISAADAVSDLGVIMDPILKYDAHINNLVGKGFQRVGVLFRGFASRSARVLKQAYVTFIRPVLEYGSSVWSPHLLKHINAIERVQKYFTRRIPALSDLSYPERLAAIDLEPLELRRLKADLILYYKCFHNLIALPSDTYFYESEQSSSTRSGGNRLLRPQCNTNCFNNDFLTDVYLAGMPCRRLL